MRCVDSWLIFTFYKSHRQIVCRDFYQKIVCRVDWLVKLGSIFKIMWNTVR